MYENSEPTAEMVVFAESTASLEKGFTTVSWPCSVLNDARCIFLEHFVKQNYKNPHIISKYVPQWVITPDLGCK